MDATRQRGSCWESARAGDPKTLPGDKGLAPRYRTCDCEARNAAWDAPWRPDDTLIDGERAQATGGRLRRVPQSQSAAAFEARVTRRRARDTRRFCEPRSGHAGRSSACTD